MLKQSSSPFNWRPDLERKTFGAAQMLLELECQLIFVDFGDVNVGGRRLVAWFGAVSNELIALYWLWDRLNPIPLRITNILHTLITTRTVMNGSVADTRMVARRYEADNMGQTDQTVPRMNFNKYARFGRRQLPSFRCLHSPCFNALPPSSDYVVDIHGATCL
ncbi:hypothetical protein BJ165DRAFT_1408379 [Panaeolus papilionaceus]|nr:hypothetical protein BJ165DRAFT_1408379 [Panaeolus papilionaceus]